MVDLDLHYVDPRLVDLYDLENPRGDDTDFYLNFAEEIGAKHIIDLGCGTGLLTCEFADEGRTVVGIDPASAMLAVAREKDNAELVQWVEGDARDLGQTNADLLVMTGNVAQVFLDDDEWLKTLAAIHDALRSGGYLAFESRNPKDEAWRRWHRDATYYQMDTKHGKFESWLDVLSVSDRRVRFQAHNIFAATGEDIVVESELRFRTKQAIIDSLVTSGFEIEHIYGDWHKQPLMDNSRLMIFVARRL